MVKDVTASTLTVLLDIISIIGEADALKLVACYGGQTPRIPALRNVNKDHPMAQCIGLEKLTMLAKEKGGSWLYVAKCDRWLRKKRNINIVSDYSDGTKVDELVQRYQLSDRQIWNILGKTDMDDRQQSFF